MRVLDGKVFVNDPIEVGLLAYFLECGEAEFYSLTVCHIIR